MEYNGKGKRMSETPDISEMHTLPAMEAMSPDTDGQGTSIDLEPLTNNTNADDLASQPHISELHTVPAMAAMPMNAGGPGGIMDFGPLIDDDTNEDDLTPLPSIPRRRRRLRWTAWAAIGLLVLLIGGGIFVYLHSNSSPPVQYTQAAVTMGNLSVTVSGSGPVQAKAVYNLNFPSSSSSASSPITAIYAKVGDRVKAGQKLAALDPTALQDAINQAQVTVNNDETSLTQAQKALSNAQTTQNTALNIAKLNEQKALAACTPAATPTPGAGTPTPAVDTDATETAESTCEQLARQQYTQAQQQANSSVTSASTQVASAQQKLSNDQTALATAKDNLKNDILLAPHNGSVEAVNGLIGETPGNSTPLIVLVDDSTLSIQASVSESDIATVKVNQPATFTVTAYPSQTFRASVTSINTVGSSSSSVVTYTVDLAVDMQSLNGATLYPTMTASANITTDERLNTLLVPSAALSFSMTALQNGELTSSQLNSLGGSGSPAGTTGSRGIVVELKAGKLVPILVTTGLTNGQQTEILSGLKEGDEVVVAQTGGKTTGSSNPSSGGGPSNNSSGPGGKSGGGPVLCTNGNCTGG
jgi:multidrug efflux pump subunit AcrA (membrane-fusion protein)